MAVILALARRRAFGLQSKMSPPQVPKMLADNRDRLV
jgi:hypothetical protein